MLIIIGYVVYQNVHSDSSSPVATSAVTTTEKIEDADLEDATQNVEDNADQIQKPAVAKENPDGIHIMADGEVMNKDGKEITDASIRADGKVQLSDGTIVTPAFDLRSNSNSKPIGVTTKPSEHVVIDIAGVDFAYDIKQIKVKKGDTVTINFKSNEGFHDWVVDEFNAATDRVTEKDGITSVTFVANKVGTFQYYCSVMRHRQMGMIGYLIVE